MRRCFAKLVLGAPWEGECTAFCEGRFERLELHVWKRACAVLRGEGGGNTAFLPTS